ncbi:unnamed protein product [Caenorhabditis angaria]|uniref:Uncharacterized protein n=1 Tax=Caenorhabditis angaria TaxID=860376 RepID=A0A9P1J101_9PELO|nr:unnamed protein product [Caenorhabditis angaria]
MSFIYGRSKGVASVLGIIIGFILFSIALYHWPVKNADEAPWTPETPTDHLLIPRILLSIFLISTTIYLVSLYAKHDLLHIIRAQLTAQRHSSSLQ